MILFYEVITIWRKLENGPLRKARGRINTFTRQRTETRLGAGHAPGACAGCVMEGWRDGAAADARLQLIAQLCLNILLESGPREPSSNLHKFHFFCFLLLFLPPSSSSAHVTRTWSEQLRVQLTATSKRFHGSINQSGVSVLKNRTKSCIRHKTLVADRQPWGSS